VLDYLDKVDPEAARVARERYGCLTPWQSDPSTHGRAALSVGYAPCEKPVIGILRDLLEKHLQYAAADGESFLDAAQNAGLLASAERYYRVIPRPSTCSKIFSCSHAGCAARAGMNSPVPARR
jgi:erythromycin esterase-like protein